MAAEYALIKNGLVALAAEDEFQPVDLLVRDGVIVAVGSDLGGVSSDCAAYDASGRWILPGCIDAHVHFDDPGYTDRENFTAGSSAAAAGGVTVVIDMPCTSIPPVTTVQHLRQKLAVIERKSVIDFGLYGGVCAQSFEADWQRDIQELSQYVLGFKTYLTSGMQTFQRLDHYRLREVLVAAREAGLPVLLHAEDNDYVCGSDSNRSEEGVWPQRLLRIAPGDCRDVGCHERAEIGGFNRR